MMSEVPSANTAKRTLAILLGVALGFVAIIIAVLFLFRTDTRPLTAADLEANAQRWQQHGPKNYNLDVKLSGRMPDVVHVEVRNGEITALTRGGGPVSEDRRVRDPWKAEGLFDTLRDEMNNAENPTGAFGVPVGTTIILRAKFDPQTGLPLKYERLAPGIDYDLAWEITRFEPVSRK